MQTKTQSIRRAFRVLSGLSLLSFALSSHAAMSGVELVNDTDWLMGGAPSMRDVGTGTVNLFSPGAVSSSFISKAYLYWAGPTDSASATANDTVTFNGSTVVGNNIGFSHDNGWGFANSQAYRADVTSELGSLTAGLNSFSLADFVKGTPDPETGTYPININGASLVVLFNDGNPLNDRDLLIFGGNDSNAASAFDGLGWGTTVNGVQWSGTPSAYLHLGVSDGQLNLTDDSLTLNGNPLIPSTWTGTSLLGGNPFTGLWDLATYDITSLLAPGSNNLTLFNGLTTLDQLDPEAEFPDITALINGIIDLPGDSYSPVPEPTTVISGLAFAGLFGARLLRRRR